MSSGIISQGLDAPAEQRMAKVMEARTGGELVFLRPFLRTGAGRQIMMGRKIRPK
jgi:hypothetical protein